MANPQQDILNAARTGVLSGLVSLDLANVALDYVSGKGVRLPGFPPQVEQLLVGILGEAEQQVGGPLFEALVAGSMGLPGLGSAGSQEQHAVDTIKRAIGFGVGLPLLVGQAEAPLKALLGANLGQQLFEALRRVPEEMGVNFFLGTALERIFEVAVGQPLEEAIAERTRPARMDWRVIRALMKAHQLSPAEGRLRLERIGYRDSDIDLLLGMADQLLSVADLQQLYLDGLSDEATIRDYLAQLGYSAADADRLVQVYLRRAETAGGDVLRSTARTGYLDDHLTRDQYRAILERLNVPEPSVALELEAADLTKAWKVHQLTLSEVKSLHAAGVVDNGQAAAQLLSLGYTDTQASELITAWSVVKAKASVPLDHARVLSYLVNGILTKQEAYTRLVNLGLRSQDAQLLVDHPTAWGGIYPHPLDQKTVVSAYQEQVIDHARAQELLDQLGVDPTERDLALEVATAKQVRGPKPKAPHKTLTEAQVLEAYKRGLASSGWAVRELVALGYSDSDAQLLVALQDVSLAGGQVPTGWQVLT